MSRWLRSLPSGLMLIVALVCAAAAPALAAPGGSHRKLDSNSHRKLDSTLTERTRNDVAGKSRVIVTFKPGWNASAEAKKLGARLGRRLNLINGQVLELSNGQLKQLADHPAVESVHWDRPMMGLPNGPSVAVGVPQGIHHSLGFTGEGVGVAIVDSGITPWHDDLTYGGASPKVQMKGGQRVAAFVDFVNGQTTPYDDYGHGTHVAGIIVGNGYDSGGARQGAAPDAHLVVLKVLDATGRGLISDVIAALDYAVEHRLEYNIRAVNLSIAAAVLESYTTDPLTRAAKRAVDAGIIVVAAAGNLGRNAQGEVQYGGITAPANAPWVLTVGAYDDRGTQNPNDDVMALYSSRGPTAIDFLAKPDLVAPGNGIVSLSDPSSRFYATKAAQLVDGASGAANQPYLSLTGTSVAAPAVTGTVALMMEANPNLTPNLAKAVLQYTAAPHPEYDALTQGAGFLDARGAVELSRYFATAREGQRYPRGRTWGRQIIWGNQLIGGGVISPSASAWSLDVVWGASHDSDGDNIVWGTQCETESCDNIVWGTFEDGDNIVWGTMFEDGDNIVWGTHCADDACDNIVWGTDENSDNIVWGTDCGGDDCGDNIVWGTLCDSGDCGDNIVWGTSEDVDNIVWGTECEDLDGDGNCDNIVWGTECEDLDGDGDCDNVVWGTSDDGDNIVWGTRTTTTSDDGDNIVWGTKTGTTDTTGTSVDTKTKAGGKR